MTFLLQYYQLCKEVRKKCWLPGFHVKIVVLNISQVTGSVFSGNLSVFDVICSKAHEMVGDTTGHVSAWLLILLPLETK